MNEGLGEGVGGGAVGASHARETNVLASFVLISPDVRGLPFG